MTDVLPARVRFGAFILDVTTGELCLAEAGEADLRVLLQEQSFRVLLTLIERDREIATREEIKKKLWPNDTVVEFDHHINVVIGKLRRALGDSAQEPRYIETLARRGYRLMVPVEWIAAAEDPPSEVVAQLINGKGEAVRMQPDPSSLTGRTVSHYRVLDIIGGGGMGVVYRAEDLKLGRAVALKFLPEELGSDPNSLGRFEREARAASSLDHPNICTVYEFGEHEGRPFMVMQLLEGQTLRDRLTATEGPLPLPQVLDIGIQISDGLEAAHEHGIIHRDIKPANIFISSKGVCKILDFGLAKLFADPPNFSLPNPVEDAFSPVNLEVLPSTPEIGAARNLRNDSLVSKVSNGSAGVEATQKARSSIRQLPAELHLTRTGSAMGTVGYMSPEQIRGEKLDARTDLFSLGSVLYEMATGQRAFGGETAASVHEAIIHDQQIPARDLNAMLPPELEAIIDKSLAKNREARYQTAAGVAAALRELGQAKHHQMPKTNRRGRWLVLSAAVMAMTALALGWRLQWFARMKSGPRPMLSERQLTHNPSEFRLIAGAISPDGKHLAYTDPKGLHVSVIATGEVHDIQLPKEMGSKLASVSWFPDGERVIVMAGPIWSVSIFGGIPRKLSDNGFWPVVSTEGSLVAFVSGDLHGIWVMGPDGENPHRILADENKVYDALAWSPVGQRLAYMTRSSKHLAGEIDTVSLEGGSPSVVTSLHLQSDDSSGMVWAQSGRIIYTLDEGNSSNLWQVLTDPRTGRPVGGPTRITNWDGLVTYWATISRDGSRLAIVRRYDRDDIYVGELEDESTRLLAPAPLTASQSENHVNGWMRDGTVLLTSNRTGRRQIYLQGLGQDSAQPLLAGPDEQDGAEQSADGQWILYWSTASDKSSTPTSQKLMRFPSKGGSPQEVLEARLDDASSFHCPSIASSSCVYSRWENNELLFYALDPLRGLSKEIARTSVAWSTLLNWSLSRDGTHIAISSLDRLPEQVRILDLQDHSERNLPMPHGWRVLLTSWASDGRAIFAQVAFTQSFLARIDLNGNAQALLDRGRSQWLNTPCASPDGRRLAFSQQIIDSNVWLMENF